MRRENASLCRTKSVEVTVRSESRGNRSATERPESGVNPVFGGVAEWFKATVLKTVSLRVPSPRTGVQSPRSRPLSPTVSQQHDSQRSVSRRRLRQAQADRPVLVRQIGAAVGRRLVAAG